MYKSTIERLKYDVTHNLHIAMKVSSIGKNAAIYEVKAWLLQYVIDILEVVDKL